MGLSLLVHGSGVERSVELDEDRRVCFGRSRRCDLVVAVPTVSRFHAELRLEGARIVLCDLDSTNGTFVNDVRCTRQEIVPGDRIRLGSAELIVLADHPPQGQAPSAGREILSGVADDLCPADLIEVLTAQRKTGTLMLYKGRFGRIDFKDGQVCFARVDGVEGEKAFHRMLGWTGAEFQFRGVRPRQKNLELPTRRLLVDHLKQQEEMKALQEALPDPDTPLRVESAKVGNLDLSCLEEEILRAVAQGVTLTAIMDASPSADVDVARAVVRLMHRGVLLPNDAEANYPQVPTGGPLQDLR